MTHDSNENAAYPLSPSLDFLQRVWRMNHTLEKLSSRMERRLGVTAQQRLIIRCVGKYPGLTAGQLASMLHLDPGTISASLRRLQNRALVVRRRDPKDKRRAALGLTAKGRALDRPVRGTVEHAVDRLLNRSNPDELQAMTRVVDELTARLNEELSAE